jgi:hypothetical protein
MPTETNVDEATKPVLHKTTTLLPVGGPPRGGDGEEGTEGNPDMNAMPNGLSKN